MLERLLQKAGHRGIKAHLRSVLRGGELGRGNLIRSKRLLTMQLSHNAALTRLRRFFCREQIFMPSLKHRAETLVCDAQ